MKPLVILFLLPIILFAQTPYVFEDLEILSKENSYTEFFSHIYDIKPSQRNDKWKTLVEETASEWAKSILTKEIINRDDFLQTESLYMHTVIKSSEYFRIKRKEIALRFFKDCFKESAAPESDCWKLVYEFWDPTKRDVSAVLDLKKILNDYFLKPYDEKNPHHLFRSKVTLRYLLSEAMTTAFASSLAQDPLVREFFWNQLIDDHLHARSVSRHFQEYIHEEGQSYFFEEASKYLKGNFSPLLKEVSYSILKIRGDLTEQEKDLYFTQYLLSMPTQGDIFNLSWAHLRTLKNNPNKREAIKSELLKLHPYPGEILGSKDLTKQTAVLREYKSNFPEYFDHYAHTCIRYFRGTASFPKGNPAHYCHELKDAVKRIPDLVSKNTQKILEDLNI